jgi:very-short-patch-repair endonuclease
MTRSFARQLRRDSTFIEKILWARLRNRYFLGLKFRRQQSIGPFIADFVCFEKKFILEVDGPHHELEKAYDQRRDYWLTKEGYQVLRITTDEFTANENLALDKIRRALTPTLSPKGRGS